jgi:hypothetical protein
VKIPKNKIIDSLRQRGDEEKAAQRDLTNTRFGGRRWP